MNMNKNFNLATNNTMFVVFMALVPLIFAGMLAGSGSVIAAIAAAVAYASVVIGERLD